MGNVILSFGNVKNVAKLVVPVMDAEINNLNMTDVCHVVTPEGKPFREGHSMKNEDFKNYANKAKEKLQNAKNMAQDKLQDMELDKKLDNLKEQTQKTMSATAEKVKEMELDKKLSNLNDNVEKYAKVTAEKTKETVSSAAKTVKDMELDKKIENSEFEKRTGIFAKIKRYRAIIAIGIIAVVAIGIFANFNNHSNNNITKTDNIAVDKAIEKTESNTKKDISTLQAQNPEYQFILGTPLQIERKALVSGQWITTGYYEGNDETETVYKQTYQDIVYCLRVGTFYADGNSDTVSLIISDTPKVPLKSWYDATRSGYGKRNQNIIMVNTIGKENYAWDFYDSHDYNIESKFQQPD